MIDMYLHMLVITHYFEVFKRVILSSVMALLLGACDLLDNSSDEYYVDTSSNTPQTPPRQRGHK